LGSGAHSKISSQNNNSSSNVNNNYEAALKTNNSYLNDYER